MEPHDPVKNITSDQIGKVQEFVGAALRKSGLPSEQTQQMLEHQGATLADEFVELVRKRVEAISNMISRHTSVNRARSGQEALDATDRRQFCDSAAVASMLQGEGDKVEVFFFKPDKSAYDENGCISDEEVARQRALRGLKPVDPFLLVAENEANSAFADEHPNCTHWKDADGRWCYAAFYRWVDGRLVHVGRDDYYWDGAWWFAGRK